MRIRTASAIAVLGVALFGTACGSDPVATTAATKDAWVPPGVTFRTGSDDGAMADLQADSTWSRPRCRWLETGAWVLAWPQETALYEAARDFGYIEMEQVGMGNRVRPEPAWKIALTDAGKAESARCGSGSSRSEVWGVPVADRRFISGRRIKEPDMYNPDQTAFEVEFEWVPTAVGDRVKHVLMNKMAVEQGVHRTRVSLQYPKHGINKGANGWWVAQIADTAMTR